MTGHYVYILRCKDDTFYTGYTVDPEKRLAMHNSGKGAKYTRGRGPCEIVHLERFEDKGDALRREIAIKKLTTAQKKALIENNS